jgi:hypothetical protein
MKRWAVELSHSLKCWEVMRINRDRDRIIIIRWFWHFPFRIIYSVWFNRKCIEYFANWIWLFPIELYRYFKEDAHE